MDNSLFNWTLPIPEETNTLIQPLKCAPISNDVNMLTDVTGVPSDHSWNIELPDGSVVSPNVNEYVDMRTTFCDGTDSMSDCMDRLPKNTKPIVSKQNRNQKNHLIEGFSKHMKYSSLDIFIISLTIYYVINKFCV
jgi:hypothetical protein